MITHKIQNTATAEERIPVKMEFNEKGVLVALQVRRGEGVEDIELVGNWKIVSINDRDTQKVVEENKKKKEKWSI